MNTHLFTQSGLYQIIKPTNAPDDEEFDYSKHYADFFEYMANQGAAEYDNPDWLKAKIDEQSKKFIADFRTVFEDGDPGNVEGALETNACFNDADEYFDAIRMKFAGNLFEAVMAAFFNHANVSDGRLQPFAEFESSFGSEDDFSGVDGWLVSASGIRIPVNAKHLANDAVTKNDAFDKLKASKLDFVKQYSASCPDGLADVLKTPDGVIFTDSVVGKSECGREFKHEQFPDVIVIDECGLFAACGNHANSVPNVTFWRAALNDFKSSFCN